MGQRSSKQNGCQTSTKAALHNGIEHDVPLPDVMHASIPDDKVQGKSVLIIGDVHGCLDELQALVRQSSVPAHELLIVFVGDVINKGPKSIETLAYIRRLNNAYTVRGNHEENVIRKWIAWKRGARELKMRERWMTQLTVDDVDFLIELPYTISIPLLSCLVVHAGLVPGQPITEQHPVDMTRMRNVTQTNGLKWVESERLWRALEGTDIGVPWGGQWRGQQHVYFGHDARRRLQKHDFATGLDTRCVYGECLTGVLLREREEPKFISIKARRVYDRKGEGNIDE